MKFPDKDFTAEILFEKKDGNEFKLVKDFDTLEDAKSWIRKKICKSSLRWQIESWGEVILSGE